MDILNHYKNMYYGESFTYNIDYATTLNSQ